MVKRQFDAVLATAAAADYAEPLGRRLGFQHVLATRADRSAGEPANAGAVKRRSVDDFLRHAGWRDRSLILFTDHLDDLPLILDCDVVCWFGSAGMLAKARAMAGEKWLRALSGYEPQNATGHGSRSMRLCGTFICPATRRARCPKSPYHKWQSVAWYGNADPMVSPSSLDTQ